ncbi:hypothetical protein LguiB_031228 [Lonicera macranthoides]
MTMMKRNREEVELDSLAMAKCLMLLSRVGEPTLPPPPTTTTKGGRIFECKTCNKQFSSFQALGGHRASHKRPKLTAGDLLTNQLHDSPPKAKTHECSICGLEFAIGQALGGHMRRHRAAPSEGAVKGDLKAAEAVVPVLRRSSSKRVMGLDLNLSLSLMPYEESGLELDLKLGHERGPMLKSFI